MRQAQRTRADLLCPKAVEHGPRRLRIFAGLHQRQRVLELAQARHAHVEGHVDEAVLPHLIELDHPGQRLLQAGAGARDVVGEEVVDLVIGQANVVEVATDADGGLPDSVLVRLRPAILVSVQLLDQVHFLCSSTAMRDSWSATEELT